MLFRISKNLGRASPPVTWTLLLVAYASRASFNILMKSFSDLTPFHLFSL